MNTMNTNRMVDDFMKENLALGYLHHQTDLQHVTIYVCIFKQSVNEKCEDVKKLTQLKCFLFLKEKQTIIQLIHMQM